MSAKGDLGLSVKSGSFSVDTIDTRFTPSAVAGDGKTLNLGYDHGL